VQPFTIGDAAELSGDVCPDQRLIGVLAELDGPIDLELLRAGVEGCLPDQPILSRRVIRHGAATWNATWQDVAVTVADQVIEQSVDDPVTATDALMVAGLPERGPLWRLLLLRSPQRTHLLFLAHHVLLDGATAVAVVGALLGSPAVQEPPPQARRHPLLRPLGLLAGVGRGVSRSSLLVPIRSGFRLRSVTVALEPLHEVARSAGATVNDVLLLAVAETLRRLAESRGERLARLAVSVPVTGGSAGAAGRNQVGAFVVAVPQRRPDESDRELLGRIARRTRWRKQLVRGSSGSPALSYLLAALGRLGWYRPLFERQRAIITLLTNLRGPAQPLNVQGSPVVSLTPVSPALGNVTVVFAAVSYAGRLRVTARLDRSVWAEEPILVDALREALDRLADTA